MRHTKLYICCMHDAFATPERCREGGGMVTGHAAIAIASAQLPTGIGIETGTHDEQERKRQRGRQRLKVSTRDLAGSDCASDWDWDVVRQLGKQLVACTCSCCCHCKPGRAAH